MGITKLLPSVHLLRDLPVVHMLRRHLRDPGLITYYNRETRQWVLAYWLDRARGIVDEIDDLGPNLENLTPEFVKSLEASRSPTNLGSHKKRLKSKRLAQARKLELDLEKSRDERTWINKKGWAAPYVDVGVPSGGGAL